MIVDSFGKWRDLVARRRLGPYWTPEWATMWSDNPCALVVTRSAWGVFLANKETVRSPSGDTGVAVYKHRALDRIVYELNEWGANSIRMKTDPLKGQGYEQIGMKVESLPKIVVLDTEDWSLNSMAETHRYDVKKSTGMYGTIAVDKPTDRQIEQFVAAYAETEKRVGFEMPLSGEQVERLFGRSKAVLCAAVDGDKIVSGAVFVTAHGVSAYHWSATLDEYVGRGAPGKLAVATAIAYVDADTVIMGAGSEDGDGLELFKSRFGNARLVEQSLLTREI